MNAHDLLRITGPDAVGPDAPAWAIERLAATPWVVVRTAAAPPGTVAVGVRGGSRSLRFGCVVDRSSVVETVAPQELRSRAGRLDPGAPTTIALAGVERLLPDTTWGPTGAVGYELATGVPTVHPGSDLDLLLEPAAALRSDTAAELIGAFAELGCRVDAQVRTPAGLVALAELAAGDTQVLARTPDGPVLVTAPWS